MTLIIRKSVSIFVIVLAAICHSNVFYAQFDPVRQKDDLSNIQLLEESANYTQLHVGDRVPDIEFNLLDGKKVRLSDFKNKLFILDFWATWCGSCIDKIPEMDTLQEEFRNQLQVILVNSINTDDNTESIKRFFEKRQNLAKKSQNLLIASEDRLADVLFPHQVVPHYVWISSSGYVKAITSSQEINPKNIQLAIQNDNLNLPIKKDFLPYRLLDLGNNEGDIPIDNINYYSMFKRGNIEGVAPLNQYRLIAKDGSNRDNFIRGIVARNLSLLDIFKAALIRSHDSTYSEKRIILETRKKTGLLYDSTVSYEEWAKNNLYSYDLVIPPELSYDIDKIMLHDLNTYSGYFCQVEKRKIKCLSLIRSQPKGPKIKNKYTFFDENVQMRSMSIRELVIRLDVQEAIPFPVINEISSNADLMISLPKFIDLTNINELRIALRKYNFDLVKKEKYINVFIIHDK